MRTLDCWWLVDGNFIEVDQRSDEWKALRASVECGASMLAVAMQAGGGYKKDIIIQHTTWAGRGNNTVENFWKNQIFGNNNIINNQ